MPFGHLDGEGIARPAAQMIQVHLTIEVVLDQARHDVRENPAVVQTVRENEKAPGKPISSDMGGLPDELGMTSVQG